MWILGDLPTKWKMFSRIKNKQDKSIYNLLKTNFKKVKKRKLKINFLPLLKIPFNIVNVNSQSLTRNDPSILYLDYSCQT